tara:strand:- start:2890 stop:5643 length:2754 start_codon:yes stop_codon:yes gene_type:complete
MSVQLVLYPQSYQGVYSTTSYPVLSEYVADTPFFFFLNWLPNYDVGSSSLDPSLDAVTNNPPIPAWRTWRSTGGFYANVTAPSESFFDRLILYSNNGAISSSGVYQKVQNLNIGILYELKIKITQAGAGGTLLIGNPNLNTTLGGGMTANLSTSSITTHIVNFTATNTEETLIVDYRNSNGSTINIESISIIDAINAPSQGYGDLSDGQVICDLYEEEDIPLSLSIDNFKNVAEKTQSYSKDFNLPATKRNNKIFSHIFDVTRTQDNLSFNPYVKTKCILKQDGYDIFKGYLRLIDISEKEDEISYNVNLYSEPVALKDILENKKFNDLDFSELDHDYNKTNIKASWYDNTGITLNNPLSVDSNAYKAALGVNNTDVLKYPFVNWKGDLDLDVNNFPVLNTLEDAFRPFINCKYILDSIFDDTPFTYKSGFINSTDFTNMFMDFNWGTGNAPNDTIHTGKTQFQYLHTQTINTAWVNLDCNSNNFSNEWGYDQATNVFTCIADNTVYDIVAKAVFTCQVAGNAIRVRLLHTDTTGAQTVNNFQNQFIGNVSGTYFYNTTLSISLQAGDTLEFQAQSSALNSFVCVNTSPVQFGARIYGSVTINRMTNSILLHTLRGELGQWEYLKGFINMFNLVMLQDKDNPNKIIIEPYNTIFSLDALGTTLLERNIKYDWTDKIDETQIKLSPLDLANKTMFKYEDDDDDYPTKYYNSLNLKNYGSEPHLGFNNAISILTGEEEISAKPFAATVIKPIADYINDLIIPVIYSSNDDQTEFESFNNKPRILYKIESSPYQFTGNTTYKIPTQNGVSGEQATGYLRFSHTSDILSSSTDTDLNYGTIQLLCGDSPLNNLYQKYWSRYYNELYNADTKYMTLKVNLNAADINDFDFSKNVMIKNKSYRVNKIEYKPNDLSTVEFILIG